jgi:hypothetical protein
MAAISAKFQTKERTGKQRHVTFTGEPKSETVEVKLYQLNAELAEPYMRDGKFSFRVAFDDTDKDGRFTRYNLVRCPLISIAKSDVLQTENETAQRMLERFCAPQNTLRNDKKRKAGNLFNDVTASVKEYNVDLDDVFTKVIEREVR